MKKIGASIRFSASHLSNHLACRHLTALDLEVAAGRTFRPCLEFTDTQILQERGIGS
jgi:uncharacterized protein